MKIDSPNDTYGRAINGRVLLEILQLEPRNVSPLFSKSSGRPLSGEADSYMGSRQGSLEPRFHTDAAAAAIVDAYDAEAVTLGDDIFARDSGLSERVLRHELAHVAQAQNPGSAASVQALEREARAVAETRELGQAPVVELSAPIGLPLSHPALRVLLCASRWLAKMTTKTLSKHVARHGRRIAGRAVHTVFRNPRRIKSLVTKAVQDGIKLARKYATKSADEILEEGGVRVFRQATKTPGKFRTIIDKDFGRAIGTKGETILRVVLDYTGRVVSAYPTDRLLAIGAGVIALEAFTASTAEAAEEARGAIEAYENRPTDWGEVIFDLVIDILSFGLLASSPLNQGESLMIELDRIVLEAAEQTIREIEEREGITLTEEQKMAIYDLARVAVGAPMEFETIEAEAEAE